MSMENQKSQTTIISIILTILAIGGIFIYNNLAWGLVLYKFWKWFVLPVFITLPTINYTQAIGLMLIISLLFRPPTKPVIKEQYIDKDNEEIATFIAPWTVLLIGWITFLVFCQ